MGRGRSSRTKIVEAPAGDPGPSTPETRPSPRREREAGAGANDLGLAPLASLDGLPSWLRDVERALGIHLAREHAWVAAGRRRGGAARIRSWLAEADVDAPSRRRRHHE